MSKYFLDFSHFFYVSHLISIITGLLYVTLHSAGFRLAFFLALFGLNLAANLDALAAALKPILLFGSFGLFSEVVLEDEFAFSAEFEPSSTWS